MDNPPELDRIRAALAEMVAGNIQLAEFEQLIAAAIAAGSLTSPGVRRALESAVVDGTLKLETLRRLGVDERDDAATIFRPARGASLKADQGGGETVLRPVAAAVSRMTQSTPAAGDTESTWVEPDSLAASGSVATGQLLGRRYYLERALGEGGMGVVYYATDQEIKGEAFAIKVLKPAIREHPESLELMREEVRKTRALHHPNIAGVYSLNSDRSGIYMLMEYLEGKTVGALIDEEFGRGMPLPRAWPLIQDIGAALAYAHDHSVIHSDLKPSNVFVTTSAKAKLLDFGIARAARGRTGRFDPGGVGALTPAYASCGMLEGRPPDQSDDVYAFACVIYEMLSGKHPFDRLSALEARAAALRPAPIASLTRAQNEALARALAFDRARRTESVEALLAGFEGAAKRGSPHALWLAAGVAVVAGGGLIAWFVSSMSPFVHRADKTALSPPVPSAAVVAPAKIIPQPVAAQSVAAQPAASQPVAKRNPVQNPISSPAATAPERLPAARGAPDSTIFPKAQVASRQENITSVSPPAASKNSAPAVQAVPRHPAPVAVHNANAIIAPPARQDPIIPPVGKIIPGLKPAASYESFADSCPYPAEARARGDTGEVVLLVYVSPDGSVLDTRVDGSSGSEVLDQAAARCVKDNARFVPKNAGAKKIGYWGRMKFNWSFGQ